MPPPLLAEGGEWSSSPPASQRWLQGDGPEEVGPLGGADFTPLPLRRWRFRDTPPAPVRWVGEAAEQTGALQRRGEGRAHGRAAATPARQQGPPRVRVRAGPEREEAARGTGDDRL